MAQSRDTDDADQMDIDRAPLDRFMQLYRQASNRTASMLQIPSFTDAFGIKPEKPQPIWNFDSLKEIPTIKQPVEPLAIPTTWIPSPFIPGLYPEHVERIKTHLVGYGDHVYGGSGSGFLDCGQGESIGYNGLSGWTGTGPKALGNGKNIWDAWKMAFDLWNDYYIEGRLDPKEIGKELLAAEKQQLRRRRGTNADSAEPDITSHPDSEDEYPVNHWFQGIAQTLKDAIRAKGPGMHGIKWVIPEPDIATVPDGANWYDPLDNTVWMPVISGETRPRFKWDIQTERLTHQGEYKDYPDLDEFALHSGYDCSTMPTPVLRSIERYGFSERQINGTSILETQRMRMWDGVTNTVFNIPSKPFSEDPDSVPIDRIVQRAYRTVTDELEIEGTPAYFPLNIRRVEKLKVSEEIQPQYLNTHLEGTAAAKRLLAASNFKKFKSVAPLNIPKMSPGDPWYINPTEQKLRCQIDRSDLKNDPLGSEYSNTRLWAHELERDDHHHAQYFVTNLDGRTLIVNGLEIKKGQVAGPLPEFAIIECPGGSVVFWWGSMGRNKGMETGQIDYETINEAWTTKRNDDPSWKNIRRSRRSVWRSMIKEKMEKIADHSEELDPAWAAWKEQARTDEALHLRGGSNADGNALTFARQLLFNKRRQDFNDEIYPMKPNRFQERPFAMQAQDASGSDPNNPANPNNPKKRKRTQKKSSVLPTPPATSDPNSGNVPVLATPAPGTPGTPLLPLTPLTPDLIQDIVKKHNQQRHNQNAKHEIESQKQYDFVDGPGMMGVTLEDYKDIVALNYQYKNWNDLVRQTGIDVKNIDGLYQRNAKKILVKNKAELTRAQQKLKDHILAGLSTQAQYAADLGMDIIGFRNLLATQNRYKNWDRMVKTLGVVVKDKATLPTDIMQQLTYGVGYWEDQAQVKGVPVESFQDTRAQQCGYQDFAEVLAKNKQQITEPNAALLKKIIASRRPFFAAEASVQRRPSVRSYKDFVATLYGFRDWDHCESEVFGTYEDGLLRYIPPPANIDPELAAMIEHENQVSRRAWRTVFTPLEIRRMELHISRRELGQPFLPAQSDHNNRLFCEL